MRKLAHLGLMILSLSIGAGCVSGSRTAPEGSRVLIVIRSYETDEMPFMTDNELGLMMDLLDDAECEYRVASISYDPYVGEKRTVVPDLLVGDVVVMDYDAVVLPCLAIGQAAVPGEVIDLVMEFHEQDKVIAAQYSARRMLYDADVIEYGLLIEREVLQEGRVITSGCCPNQARFYGCENTTRELIDRLIEELK